MGGDGNGGRVESDMDVKDPVCGMLVRRHAAKAIYHFEGQLYYFCSADCMGKFVAQPEKYISPAPSGAGMCEAREVDVPPPGSVRNGE